MVTKQPDSVQTRRLSAVMFTDMVGYSQLVQKNEAAGLRLLAEQREIVRDVLGQFRGREVDTAGDAFFVEFGSALDATQCAIEIQRVLHERNKGMPLDQMIVLRIGLHLGDVVHVGNQVQGDGVNIAARMEPLARPGSICVSEDIARQIHNKIDVPLAPIGKQKLKNIRLPMDAYRLILPWEEDDRTVRPFHEFAGRRKARAFVLSRTMQVGAAIVIAIAVAWGIRDMLQFRGPSPVEGLSPSLVAVLPFTVQGGPDFAYLGKGMVDLLSTKLDGAGPLQTVDPRALLGLLSQESEDVIDPGRARRLASSLGAGRFVMGNIVEVGGQLRIDAAVYLAESREPAAQGTVEGSASEIFELLDRLAAQLVIDPRGPGVPLESLSSMTTTSFEALKHYLQGVNAFRMARFQAAADELELAVETDSTFALAWYQLSATADWLFDPVRAYDAVRHASRFSDRLSDRGKRLVAALEATKAGRNAEALQLYRDFLTRYPDDVEAWYQLGELTFHAGPMIGISPQESLEAWERLLFFEPDQITALIHMARVWMLERQIAKFDSVSNVIIGLEPDAERNIELKAHLAFNRRDPADVQKVMDELRRTSDDMLVEVLWSIATFRDDPHEALLVADILTDKTRSVEVRVQGFVSKAYLLASIGQLENANEALDEGETLGNRGIIAHRAYLKNLPFSSDSEMGLRGILGKLRAWDAGAVPVSSNVAGWYSAHNGLYPQIRDYLIGLISARLRDRETARNMASRLESSRAPDVAGSILPDLALGVRAQMSIEAGDSTAALPLLEAIKGDASYQYAVSSPFSSRARERFIHAEILRIRGDRDRALELMRSFEGHSLFDLVYLAPSLLHRGEIAEAEGDLDEAISCYRRFVEMWKDADPKVSILVTDVRFRLASLGV